MKKNKLLQVPQMLQIGSTGRNSGKTVIAKSVIHRLGQQRPVVAVKIITITGDRGKCQRGGTGCGICTSISSGFELIEETNQRGKKDTMELLKAGCEKVFLLKAFQDHLLAGFQAFLKQVPANAVIICESNSIRQVVQPGLFIMINNHKNIKPSAAAVYAAADVVVASAEDQQVAQIQIQQPGTWRLQSVG
jgi:hypothetical protein